MHHVRETAMRIPLVNKARPSQSMFGNAYGFKRTGKHRAFTTSQKNGTVLLARDVIGMHANWNTFSSYPSLISHRLMLHQEARVLQGQECLDQEQDFVQHTVTIEHESTARQPIQNRRRSSNARNGLWTQNPEPLARATGRLYLCTVSVHLMSVLLQHT